MKNIQITCEHMDNSGEYVETITVIKDALYADVVAKAAEIVLLKRNSIGHPAKGDLELLQLEEILVKLNVINQD